VAIEPAGDYVAVVVRLQQAGNGQWWLHVAGSASVEPLPLVPLQFTVRLWRAKTGIVRGRLQLQGNDVWVPFQSTTQLEALIRDWLFTNNPQQPDEDLPP